MNITRRIFEEHKPAGGEQHVLYTVPPGSTATGTLYVANQGNGDRIWVQMVKTGSALPSSDPQTYVLYSTPLYSMVPIYLQQLYLGQGDSLQVMTESGQCSFVFTGEEYVS
jgi:outer membrane protein assembly factor BamB